MLRAHRHGLGDFFVHDDMNLHPFLGFAQQDLVETPFREVGRWTTEVQLRGQPPILCVSNSASDRLHDWGLLARIKIASFALSSISEIAHM
jgi:hypothetical protein